jgi:hypothetical protein
MLHSFFKVVLYVLVWSSFSFDINYCHAQVAGDYRSRATGNWSATATWQYYNGTAWIAATKYPGQISGDKTVTIRSPHVVTWDLASFPAQFDYLVLNASAGLIDRVGAYPYNFQVNFMMTIQGTMFMVNTTDATASVTAGNINITSTGSLSVHTLRGALVNNAGFSSITDVMQAAVTWNNQTGGTLGFGGVSIAGTLNTNATGPNTVNYNSASGNQTIAAPADGAYYDLTLSGAGSKTKTLSTTTIVNHDVYIQGNSAFSLAGFDLSVGGNWINQSTNANCFVPGTGAVIFNGATPQNILNTGAVNGTRFYKLVTANTYGISPQILTGNIPITVTNTLEMISGIINFNSAQIFSIGDSYTVANTVIHSGAASAGWIEGGSVLRYFKTGTAIASGSTQGMFPIGTSTEFRPVYFSCPTTPPSTNTDIKVGFSPLTNTTIVNIADTGGPIVRLYNGNWALLPSVTASGTFNIKAGGTGFGVIGDITDLRLCHATSVIGTAGTNSGTTSFPLVERIGVTAANLAANYFFYIGSVNAVRSPLPVELVSFGGKPNGATVDLEWETRSEVNNYRFTVLRSIDGENFSILGSVDGSGTTNKEHAYSMIDPAPEKGNNYYRLAQMDFDGKSEILSTIAVATKEGGSTFAIYPNPLSEGQMVTVTLNGLRPHEEQEIQVMDLRGEVHLIQTIIPDENGTFRGQINTSFSQGIYFLRINSTTKKLLVGKEF